MLFKGSYKFWGLRIGRDALTDVPASDGDRCLKKDQGPRGQLNPAVKSRLSARFYLSTTSRYLQSRTEFSRPYDAQARQSVVALSQDDFTMQNPHHIQGTPWNP